MIKDILFAAGGFVVATVLYRYSPTLQAKITADLDALKAKIEALKAKL